MIIEACEWLGQAVGEGRFLVVRCLRDGGMSQIFLAEDKTTGKHVIVKVPKLENVQYDANFLQRFLREIRALKRLAHPNIVRILCHGEERGTPFLVLRYLEGGTLGDRMYTGPEQTPEAQSMERLFAWLPTFADTLDYIHGKGYVHRDIKPHNILFDGDGKPFLGDLGVARVLAATPGDGSALTRVGERAPGTPPYMSPEQICGQTGGAWSDQFALGVIVYEWLTGRRPFAGLSAEEVFDFQRERLTPTHAYKKDIPESVSDVVARALARRPADRFPTCQEFVSELMAAQTFSRIPTLAGKATRIATRIDLQSASNDEEDFVVSVHEEPTASFSTKTPAPVTRPVAPLLFDSGGVPLLVQDSYNEPPSLPTAPPVPEPLPVPVRRTESVIEETVGLHHARSWSGRLSRWVLVLLLLIAAGFSGSFFLPGTQAQQWLGQPFDPLLKHIDAPGWKRDAIVPAVPEDGSRISQLEDERARLATELEALKANLRESSDEVNRTRLDLEYLRKQSARDVSRAAETAKKAEEHSEALKKENDHLVRAKEKLRSENDLLGKEKNEIRAENVKLRNEKELARAENVKLRSEKDLARAENVKLEQEKNVIGKQRDEAKNDLAEAARLALAAEAERDRAKQEKKDAENSKAAAEKKAAAAHVDLDDTKGKLKQIEQAAKQTKLWFVLKNATDTTVTYQIRSQSWSGAWSEWKETTIGKKETKAVSAPPGSIRIEVFYNSARSSDEKQTWVKGINAQSFRELAKPSAKDIDSVYTFKFTPDRKKIKLGW
jgi:serine/threonine protein kinase